MSERENQFGSILPSPVVRYYSWASNEKAFRYYDKEQKVNKNVFPLNYVFLTGRSGVFGWDDTTQSGIWSNLVKNSAKETLNVNSRKPNSRGNTLLATGFYKDDIKGKVAGAHFEKVIFGYEEGVGLVQINLKGSGVGSYSNFEKANKNLLQNYICVQTFENAKKGATKYTVPNFVLGEKVNEVDKKIANDLFKEIDNWLIAKSKSPSFDEREDYVPDDEDGSEQEVHPLLVESGDDLPF